MARIKELHPSTFDLTKLDDKLTCMALIHSLRPDYSHFTSFLALLTGLDKDKVKAAFQTKDINRRPCPDMSAATTSALSATATVTSCKCDLSLPCTFCEKLGHCVCKCFALQHAKMAYKMSKGKRRKPNVANQAQAQPTLLSTTLVAHSSAITTLTAIAAAANVIQDVVEHAGNASDHSSDTSVPPSTSWQDADLVWNADLGATSHMTPHRQWLCNYTPHCILITLANNTVIYSASVWSIVFHPKLKREVTRVVEFTHVLHVPDLHNNLLSILYLTHHADFVVSINSTHMTFACPPGPTLFVVTITGNNAVFLDGITDSVTEQVLPVMTVPLDWSLWHR